MGLNFVAKPVAAGGTLGGMEVASGGAVVSRVTRERKGSLASMSASMMAKESMSRSMLLS